MCESVEIPKGEGRGPILVTFQRDNSIRATEIIIGNTDRDGEEGQGMRVICQDSGNIRGGVDLIEGVDIVGTAEQR